MPLHAHNKRAAGIFQPFDAAVRRKGGGAEAVSEPPDGLMVKTVDGDTGNAQNVSKHPGNPRQRMRHAVFVTGHLRNQGPPRDNIHDLHSPADPENRHSGLAGGTEEKNLETVEIGIICHPRFRRSPVRGGINVPPACNQKAVRSGKQKGQQVLILRQRQGERKRAAAQHRPKIQGHATTGVRYRSGRNHHRDTRHFRIRILHRHIPASPNCRQRVPRKRETRPPCNFIFSIAQFRAV